MIGYMSSQYWAGSLALEEVGNHAYRYRPNNNFLIDTIRQALLNNAIWMSPLSTQDDLIEASIAATQTDFSKEHDAKNHAIHRLASFIKQSNSELEENSAGRNKTDEQFIAHVQNVASKSLLTDLGGRLLSAKDEELPALIEEVRSELRCACFAETPLSSPMWGLYASNNTGVCLEYEDYYNCGAQIFHLRLPRNVVYSDDERTLDRYQIWEALAFLKYSQIVEQGMFSIRSGDDPRVLACKKLFLTKNTQWEWQKEFRVVDFGNQGGYAKWPHLKLKRVIFGKRTSEDLIDEILGQFAGQVLFSRIETSPGSPDLHLVELE
jgi:hypothetical protein